jgi:phage/plasmid-like protein (TIGR03299 family)
MGSAYALDGAKSADEARVAAGLDWEAEHRPLFIQEENDGAHADDEIYALVEKERAVVRSDNGEMFGVVGREHKMLSNADMFKFADEVLAAADTTWEAAKPVGGALGGGRQPFLAVQLGEGVKVAGLDAVNCALLLSDGKVGNTAFTGTVTPLVVGCSNVVRAAIRGKSLYNFTIQHSGNLDGKVQSAQQALAVTSLYMAEFKSLADQMAAIDMGIAEFDDFLTELVPLNPDAGDRAKKTVEDTRGHFHRNWRDSVTLNPDLRNTRWGAINVVTEVIDWGNLDVRKSKVPAPERRVRSVHFGSGAALRDRAFSILGGAR